MNAAALVPDVWIITSAGDDESGMARMRDALREDADRRPLSFRALRIGHGLLHEAAPGALLPLLRRLLATRGALIHLIWTGNRGVLRRRLSAAFDAAAHARLRWHDFDDDPRAVVAVFDLPDQNAFAAWRTSDTGSAPAIDATGLVDRPAEFAEAWRSAFVEFVPAWKALYGDADATARVRAPRARRRAPRAVGTDAPKPLMPPAPAANDAELALVDVVIEPRRAHSSHSRFAWTAEQDGQQFEVTWLEPGSASGMVELLVEVAWRHVTNVIGAPRLRLDVRADAAATPLLRRDVELAACEDGRWRAGVTVEDGDGSLAAALDAAGPRLHVQRPVAKAAMPLVAASLTEQAARTQRAVLKR